MHANINSAMMLRFGVLGKYFCIFRYLATSCMVMSQNSKVEYKHQIFSYILNIHAVKCTKLIYAISEIGPLVPSQLVKAIGTGTGIPTSMPRQVQKPSQESQHKPVQTPTQEACYRAQDTPLVNQQMVYTNTRRWTKTDSGSKSSPLKTRHSFHPKQHVKPG